MGCEESPSRGKKRKKKIFSEARDGRDLARGVELDRETTIEQSGALLILLPFVSIVLTCRDCASQGFHNTERKHCRQMVPLDRDDTLETRFHFATRALHKPATALAHNQVSTRR